MSNIIRKPYLRIALYYALFGLLWIILSDRILLALVPDLEKLVTWQTYKGWFFVAVSTLLIYAWLAASNRRQQKMQDALVKSEKTYRLLFENNPLPMWVYDLETLSFLAVNEAAVDKYGYSRDEFLAMSIRDIRPPEDIPRLLADVAQTTRRLNYAGEWRHRQKDGSVFPVEITSHELVYDGRSARLVIANDLTDRKRAKDALKESEARFRTAIEEAPFPVVIHADDGEILGINRIWTEITGYRLDEIPTMPEWTKRAYGDRQRPIQDGINRLYKIDQRVNEGEFQITCKDGSQRIWEFTTVPLGTLPDGRRAVISAVVDNTERKQAQIEREYLLDQVKAQAEQLSQVMRSVPEGVVLLGPDDQVLLTNPQADHYLALLAQAKIGDRLTQLGDLTLEAVQTSPQLGQWHIVKENGRVFEIIARPVETGPVPQGWVLVLRDVTEQQEVQRQLQQQERLAAVGQLAAGIAHDFNNIMAIIVLYAQLLERDPTLSAKQQGKLATITQQASQASELIQQILDFSRRSLLTRQPLDFLSLLQGEVNLLRRTLPENIEIELVSEPDEYMLEADPTRLQQTLMNLAINARDAMPHGGHLHFDLAKIEVKNSKRALFPGMAAGSWIRLKVTDTGSGIESAFLEHVFEPFFTTKEPGKGTGLGLAQVHGIIGQHNGHIAIDSQIGVGTTFTIYLPTLAPHERSTTNTGIGSFPHGQGELLLVVEDKSALREALVESLTMLQYRVLEASNGEEALAILAQQGTEVTAVLSDVIMPKIGGLALLQLLRQQGWKMPVILMSGHPLDVELPELREKAAPIILTKPIQTASLAQAVASALKQN